MKCLDELPLANQPKRENLCEYTFCIKFDVVSSRGGGGGNCYICWYGLCHFWGYFFRAENNFWGIIFDKITCCRTFWGVILENELFWVMIFDQISLFRFQVLDGCHNFRVKIFNGL